MAESTKEALMQACSLTDELKVPTTKITVVGAGQVGTACAFSIIQQVRQTKRCTIQARAVYTHVYAWTLNYHRQQNDASTRAQERIEFLIFLHVPCSATPLLRPPLRNKNLAPWLDKRGFQIRKRLWLCPMGEEPPPPPPPWQPPGHLNFSL